MSACARARSGAAADSKDASETVSRPDREEPRTRCPNEVSDTSQRGGTITDRSLLRLRSAVSQRLPPRLSCAHCGKSDRRELPDASCALSMLSLTVRGGSVPPAGRWAGKGKARRDGGDRPHARGLDGD